MFKAYKYRIYPTEAQKVLLEKHFGCARYVYNWALSTKIQAYQTDQITVSKYDLGKQLPQMKRQDETSWLAEVNAQSLQASLDHLDKAYKGFFKRKQGFPRFKSKHSRQSFACPQDTRVDFEEGLVYIRKFKEGINCVFSRTFEGKIKTATVTRTTTRKYYISILVDTPEEPVKKPAAVLTKAVGIDLGIKTFATLSNGEKIYNPRHLKKDLQRLKVLQRRASRKQKGSANRRKANLKVALLHEKITNRRLDFLHKVTTKLVRENQTICLEDLNVQGMIKNHRLAQSISDVSWSTFNRLLEYKAEWYGVNIKRIGRFEPSSKMCPCGRLKDSLSLSDRVWVCECGVEIDRDLNAARNILKFAFHPYVKDSGRGSSGEPVEMSSLEGSEKQESYPQKI